jgi:Dna[CI] antecedent, DciA
MERLRETVAREVGALGEVPGMAELVSAWPAAVGEQIARHAWPARLARDGTLHVATADSSWAYELTQLGPSLLARLGELAPKQLKFAPGPIPESDSAAASSPLSAPPEPGPELRSQAAELASPIVDEELRELVARAAAASLARAADNRSF